jgi:hypothetical protein
VHVLGPPQANGSTIYAQRDSEPCDNSYPTWQWQPGELIVESVNVPLPADLPAGTYDIAVGWYDSLTQVRFPLVSTTGDLSGSFPVGTLAVQPR